jgi:hypothetical protein
MKSFLGALVLCPWLALSAWSQGTPFPFQPLSGVQQFLGLTDDQVTAILQNNNDYNNFASQQQQQIQNAQSQIHVETAKDQLDPLALGTLYASIETSCRALLDKASTSQQQNVSLLTDAQKVKLNALNDAIMLAPIISAAQSGNLLGSAASPPSSFISASVPVTQFFYPVGYSGFSGCAVNLVVSGVLGGILPPPTLSPTQPGVAGLRRHQRSPTLP